MNLSICFLLDTSASMAGPRLEALKEAYEQVRTELQAFVNPTDRLLISMLTYAGAVQWWYQNADLAASPLPALTVGGTSSLGKALDSVQVWLNGSDSQPTIVFLLTDGAGTDHWPGAGEQFHQTHSEHAVMIGIGCGRDADLKPLERFLDLALNLAHSRSAMELEDALSDARRKLYAVQPRR